MDWVIRWMDGWTNKIGMYWDSVLTLNMHVCYSSVANYAAYQ